MKEFYLVLMLYNGGMTTIPDTYNKEQCEIEKAKFKTLSTGAACVEAPLKNCYEAYYIGNGNYQTRAAKCTVSVGNPK